MLVKPHQELAIYATLRGQTYQHQLIFQICQSSRCIKKLKLYKSNQVQSNLSTQILHVSEIISNPSQFMLYISKTVIFNSIRSKSIYFLFVRPSQDACSRHHLQKTSSVCYPTILLITNSQHTSRINHTRNQNNPTESRLKRINL